MPLSSEKLEKLLRGGDVTAVIKFFQHASEADRRAVAPQVVEWCQRLNLNWRSQFNQKAAAEIERAGRISNWHELMPAANTAALACATLQEIKALDGFRRVTAEAGAATLRDRRPPWLDEYAELLCAGELSSWGSSWPQVRALVKAGLCQPPRHNNYVLDALNAIWPYHRGGERPELVKLLLAERDWLASDFWRLFAVDGTSEVSLANCEKYGKSRTTWTEALVELSKRGVLSRERLLDASLAALGRDFVQFRSGWFSRFHEALKPTPDERVARVEVYLRLLASSIPPTVAFALEAVAVVDKARPLRAAKLAGALQPVLNARGKAVVKGALQLLDAAAGREPDERKTICLSVVSALLNETPDVQKAVFDFLDRQGDRQDPALVAKLRELSAAVTASLRPRLTAWLGATSADTKSARKAAAIPAVSRMVSRIDSSRAIAPIANLDDLIHVASAVLEDPANPTDIERVLDGLSRLGQKRPTDFDKRVGPLRKRAMKKSGSGSWRPLLDHGLAMLFLTWADGDDSRLQGAWWAGRSQYSFLFERLQLIGRQLKTGRALPLLSAPTHLGGWIEPRVLVKRWLAWQDSGLQMDLHEQVLALLRMAPEGRPAALSAAKVARGESGQALRYALGEDLKMGREAALWLAAARSRQPFGDLPEFERRHPRLGPDAGTEAQFGWQAVGERKQSREHKWTSLELELQRKPPFPKQVQGSLLPVLFHTAEDGDRNLTSWAAQLWPANREALFAYGCGRLEISVDYADASDREYHPYLEPLAEPHTELRPMARLALALGLAAQDNALRGRAQDGLIAAITEGRVKVDELGGTMSRLLDTGINKFARWAKVLRDVARVSEEHTTVVAELMTCALHGDPAKAPRDINVLLEMLYELLSETGGKLNDARAKEYLAALKAGGKTAKLVRQLLAL
jgi:hypothetical protein